MSQTIEERLKEAKDDMDKAQTFIPYGKFNDGENKLEIDTTSKLEKSKFGRTTYTETLNGDKVKISLPKSVEMQILLGLKKNRRSFSVLKTGEGMKTKYQVK